MCFPSIVLSHPGVILNLAFRLGRARPWENTDPKSGFYMTCVKQCTLFAVSALLAVSCSRSPQSYIEREQTLRGGQTRGRFINSQEGTPERPDVGRGVVSPRSGRD